MCKAKWVLVAGVLGSVSSAWANSPEILIKFRPSGIHPMTIAVASALQLERSNGFTGRDFQRYTVGPRETAESAARWMRSMPGVEWAEPNYTVKAFKEFNDPRASSQWGFNSIRLFSGFEVFQSIPGAGPVVAVVDTGVDLDHPDLAGKLLPGQSFVTGWETPDDDNGHGTHCAGTIAAIQDNGVGIAGMSAGAKVLPVKVLGSDGSGSVADVAAGITWAANSGANIISLSLGGTSKSAALDEAIAFATGKGVLVIGAAGNAGSSRQSYPAASPGVLSVGATDIRDARASFSNYGPSWVEVAAPGVEILSTTPGGTYESFSGTSMSAPFVAGLAALMWEKDGADANAASIFDRICVSSDTVGTWLEYGRVNVRKALDALPGASLTVDAPTEIAGGSLLRVKVTLASPAGQNGQIINIASSNVNLVKPGTNLKIPAGSRQGQFQVRTVGVGTDTTVGLTIMANNHQVNREVVVLSPQLASIRSNRARLAANTSTVLRVQLSAPAPAATTISLVSNNTGLKVPATVVIRKGSRFAYTTIRAQAGAKGTAVITATFNGRSRETQVQLPDSGS